MTHYIGFALTILLSLWWMLFPASVLAWHQRASGKGKDRVGTKLGIRLMGLILAALAVFTQFFSQH